MASGGAINKTNPGEVKKQMKDNEYPDAVRATTKDLVPAEPLADLVEKGAKFRITGYYLEDYSIVDIMQEDKTRDEAFRLEEAIMDEVEKEICLSEKPTCKDVVLAPMDDGRYQRGTVFKINKDTSADVYFFDVGGWRRRIPIDLLRPITKKLLQWPMLGYQVKLRDAPEKDEYLICVGVFEKKIKKMQKQIFSVEIGEPLDSCGFFRYDKIINLYHGYGSKRYNVGEELKSMEVWPWEHCLGKGNKTDNEICEDGPFGSPNRYSFMNTSLSPFEFEIGIEGTCSISRIERGKTNSDLALLNVVLVKESTYGNYFNVLHHQLNLYAENVTSCPYYPAVGESLMLKLDKELYTKFTKFAGNWCRGLRYSLDNFYLVDFDDFVPIAELVPGKYELRRLCIEFFSMPLLCIQFYPRRKGKIVKFEDAGKYFETRLGKEKSKRYHFKIVDKTDDGCYEAIMV